MGTNKDLYIAKNQQLAHVCQQSLLCERASNYAGAAHRKELLERTYDATAMYLVHTKKVITEQLQNDYYETYQRKLSNVYTKHVILPDKPGQLYASNLVSDVIPLFGIMTAFNAFNEDFRSLLNVLGPAYRPLRERHCSSSCENLEAQIRIFNPPTTQADALMLLSDISVLDDYLEQSIPEAETNSIDASSADEPLRATTALPETPSVQPPRQQFPHGTEMFDLPVPKSFRCALSDERMQEPVVSPARHAFESSAIEAHLRSNATCPITGQPLLTTQLHAQPRLKQIIARWTAEHRIGAA